MSLALMPIALIPAALSAQSLRAQVDSLHMAMTTAFASAPASTAKF